MEFIRRHKRIIQIFFYVLIFGLLGYFIHHELQGIDWRLFRQSLGEKSLWVQIGLLLTGLLGFSVNGLYDLNATRDYPLTVPPLDILKIGWISQAFNEFIDFGGLTGGTLRAKFYKKAGLPAESALQLSVMNWAASFLGLVFLIFLALPLAWGRDLGWPLVLALVFTLYLPAFLVADRLAWVQRLFDRYQLQRISWRKKWGYVAVSILDWSAALAYFLFVMSLFNPNFALSDGLLVYVVSIVVGLFSFVPGGVGAFDVTVLLLMQKAGYETANVLAGLVVLRVCYYIIPWLLASAYVFGRWYREKTEDFHLTFWSDVLVKGLALVMFIGGALLVSTALAPELFDRIRFLNHLVPRLFEQLSAFITLIIGIVTLLLSLGINARVRRVYQTAMVLLPLGAGLCLVRGFSYREALLVLIVWILLYANRQQFIRASVPLTRRNIMGASLLTLLVLGVTSVAVAWHILRLKGELVITVNLVHLMMSVLIVVGLALLLLFSQSKKLRFQAPGPDELAAYLELVAQYGGTEYSHLVRLLDKQIFFSPDREAALLYRAVGRNMLVLGDPVGQPEAFDGLLQAFASYAHNAGMQLAYYEVSPRYLDNFCNMGYLTVKIGEAAIISLADFTFEGKKNRNRRQIRNAMEKAGLRFEVLNPPHAPELLAELKGISDAWLEGRSEMAYSLGAFQEDYLQTSPLFVLRSDERIEAFANLMPISATNVSIDLMRFRGDTVDNAMQMLLLQILAWAKEAGYESFDLGMAPLANVGDQTYSRSRDRVIRLVYEYGNRVYGFKGLRAYKDKFRPHWENRYLIYAEASALPQILLGLYEAVNHSYKKKEK
ncbi:bifunctional lysylphosphatidylglycerol flippase/synthetase MprF [Aerococcus sp. UMB8608]|uniref:bifunctional lysylphosphatidylglycerol flippase/synthetase MprF n=1 Tax=Aerococcus sp. UMB8608 TaxID=3046347 RepID=UPI00254DC249|nr:bifunctional lysylphosphatidylglycerol flippase/synthetase MprF [Aerococcus sp. UMB8608]MDK6680074.1 bifunctional lysylphosphatidylglycerol flippase/synthetase MprF [Aerococcus sp. UMB8608]